jgi:hypothetical protein
MSWWGFRGVFVGFSWGFRFRMTDLIHPSGEGIHLYDIIDDIFWTCVTPVFVGTYARIVIIFRQFFKNSVDADDVAL